MTSDWRRQLRKGAVDLCVLAALVQGEAYGYELSKRLKSSGLEIRESTLYPALARLARQGLLDTRKVPSNQGPARRYFQLSPSGLVRLHEMRAEWATLMSAVATLGGTDG